MFHDKRKMSFNRNSLKKTIYIQSIYNYNQKKKKLYSKMLITLIQDGQFK